MTLQALGSRIRRLLGDDHWLLRASRPFYEVALDIATFGRGYRRTINGLDTFYVHPRARGLVPEEYEPPVYRHLHQVTQPGWRVLSVGSHVGIYVMMLARRVGASGQVWAFEPNPVTRRLLTSHVRRNRLRQRVTTRPEAVSDVEGTLPFVATGIEGYSRLGTPHPDAVVRTHRTFEVPVTTVDAFCRSRGIVPNLLLVDVEGFEDAVLAGATETLAALPALAVVVEFHPEVWGPGTADRLRGLLHRTRRRPRPLTPVDDVFARHCVVTLEPA